MFYMKDFYENEWKSGINEDDSFKVKAISTKSIINIQVEKDIIQCL